MKKKKHRSKMIHQSAANQKSESNMSIIQEPTVNDDEDTNQGFSDWLQSPAGVGYMRVFVIANSVVLFLTLTWPQVNVFWDALIASLGSITMIGGVVRCFFLIAILGWYSASVWRTMDAYFRDEFKKHLAKESRKNNPLEDVAGASEKLGTKPSHTGLGGDDSDFKIPSIASSEPNIDDVSTNSQTNEITAKALQERLHVGIVSISHEVAPNQKLSSMFSEQHCERTVSTGNKEDGCDNSP